MWHDVVQNTEEWNDLRLGIVTCSNLSCIMANYGKAFGKPARRYALKIALEIATDKRSEFGFKNLDMERGHEQEPIARYLYSHETFLDVTNGGFFDNGRYGASPDGLVGSDGIIEIKSVIPETHYENMKRRAPDPAYKWQYIGHLDCTGRDWVDCISFCSDFTEEKKLIINRIYRGDCDKDFEMLCSRLNEFFVLIKSTLDEIQA